LRIYPVKSMGGVAVDAAEVEPWGLAGDRRWGVIDESVSHSRQGHARAATDEVNRWLSDRLATAVRLVWRDDPTVRSIAAKDGGVPGEHLSLADAGPLLPASQDVCGGRRRAREVASASARVSRT
jgi:uncharacterized protein